MAEITDPMDSATPAEWGLERPVPIKVFFSYHHKLDHSRVAQIRTAAPIEANIPATDKEWETVAEDGEFATERWINAQLYGRTCLVVLIGPGTAGRKWINYEINKAWTDNKGVVGIYVHNLKDSLGNQSAKGANPFDRFMIDGGARRLSSVVKAYDPPYMTSPEVFGYITTYIAEWVEEAIEMRRQAARAERTQSVIRNV
jgi:hypothetical protein